jgi:dynein heavy chain
MTGILQNMARKYTIPIDMVIWNYYVQRKERGYEESSFKRPDKGCYVYGAFMEGARWDDETQAIGESHPKVLYDYLPAILLDPVEKSDDKTPAKHYGCPCYKTGERRGVLSTTGHSTNFVTTFLLPIAEQHTNSYWAKRGTAMLTGLND